MIPPCTTHQTKQVTIRGGKPKFYEPYELKDARRKLKEGLSGHTPAVPYSSAVQLVTKWCFPHGNKHRDGEYRTSRPDTDNLQKLLKDVMTTLGFWTDDAVVASEVVEKFWADVPGIYIAIREV